MPWVPPGFSRIFPIVRWFRGADARGCRGAMPVSRAARISWAAPHGRDLAWRRPDGGTRLASAAIRPNATGWPCLPITARPSWRSLRTGYAAI